ncbi:hypothetical protein [Cystobacter ferrugineus]|uniref:Uncharacterized protein n=1 Tax=Cystobacter ferrugineus TaxID=83449 RepID=A0A1L9B7M8_9BACT|nr:hypothetical protein [Cystobacter ferrugineus]OJH38260.1 hypothetical protein BON30_24275 [Cystobacter ferrugineus]
MSARTTLLDLFTPPDGLMGQTAILVAMSGTRGFLDSALHRFTGIGRQRRAAAGCPFAYLFLDAHPTANRERTFNPLDVPGLHELQPRDAARENLLHAKVALLAFGPGRHGAASVLRLGVTTANWTERSSRHQLELLWKVDVSRGPEGFEGSIEELSDLSSAGSFIQRLAARYHVPMRGESRSLLARRYHDLLDQVVALEPSHPRRRFLHSWDDSLFEQFRRHLATEDGQRKNLLVCGSGSFEEPPPEKRRGRKPEVLQKLESLAAPTAARLLAAEPANAGALASWWTENIETEGWDLVRSHDPDARGATGRDLHAKFIYVGYQREASCSNGWLYLGSGNLTRRGLLLSADARGNVETGVFLRVAESVPREALLEALFVSEDSLPADELVEKGPDSEADVELAQLIGVPPLLIARARSDREGGGPRLELVWRDDVESGTMVALWWAAGSSRMEVRPGESVPVSDGRFPATVEVSIVGGDGTAWAIPVESELGHFCLPPPSACAFDEALDALLEFPIESEGDDEDEWLEGQDNDSGDPPDEPAGRRRGGAQADPRQYPLHTAMHFIDRLGAHQSGLAADLLEDWLHHLETGLPASFAPEQVAAWRGLGINFSDVLRANGFRPPGMSPVQAKRYRRILEHALRSWGL